MKNNSTNKNYIRNCKLFITPEREFYQTNACNIEQFVKFVHKYFNSYINLILFNPQALGYTGYQTTFLFKYSL